MSDTPPRGVGERPVPTRRGPRVPRASALGPCWEEEGRPNAR